MAAPPLMEKKESSKCADLAFKTYVVCASIGMWSSYSLLIRYHTLRTRPEDMFFTTTIVLAAEVFKCLVSLVGMARDAHFDAGDLAGKFRKDVLEKPWDLARLAVPSVLYAVANNLGFVALRHLNPAVVAITQQSKIVVTALMMMWMLGRRFSVTRWAAMFAMMVGVAIVQIDNLDLGNGLSTDPIDPIDHALTTTTRAPRNGEEKPLVGVAAITMACTLSAFAGVWFERVLKNAEGLAAGFWVRNFQLYITGIAVNVAVCAANDGLRIADLGLFHGWDSTALTLGLMLATAGIYVSLLVKHLDNLLKSFTTSLSIVTLTFASVLMFGMPLTATFCSGSLIVIASLCVYNLASE